MFGPLEDVEGECNARLFLGDDWGDNTCTFRCGKSLGHDGTHLESGERSNGGTYIIEWTDDERDTIDDPYRALDDLDPEAENYDE